jgi:hypothetical protein
MRNDDNYVEITDDELESLIADQKVDDEDTVPDLDSVEDDGYDISELDEEVQT